MSEIVITIVLSTIFFVFALYYYRKPENKNKKLLRETVSRDVFFLTFIAPLVAAAIFTYLITLIFREGDTDKFFKSDVLLLTSIFYLYGVFSVSQGIHALAKSFKPQVIRIKDKKLTELVHFFHGPFSHYTGNISFTLIFSLLLIYNANHPTRQPLNFPEILIVVFCGMILGINLTINYVIGNTLRLMRFLLPLIFLLLAFISRESVGTLRQMPLTILVLSAFGIATIILFLDSLKPTKNWFSQRIDEKFVSVDKDWNSFKFTT